MNAEFIEVAEIIETVEATETIEVVETVEIVVTVETIENFTPGPERGAVKPLRSWRPARTSGSSKPSKSPSMRC